MTGIGKRDYGRAAAVAAALSSVALTCAAMAGPSPDRRAKQWEPVEWRFKNPGCKGNPFDLEARATFTHAEGGKITTGMFHAGQDEWALRFTGTKPGRWTFTTASAAGALHGLKGTVIVAPNPRGRGFVTGFGDKWGWSGGGGVFVPQLVMYKTPDLYHNQPARIDADIKTFLVDHGFNGFHTMVFCRWFDIARETVRGLSSKDPNPDPRTFEALELLIAKTHAAGGMVHIWAWGDESRRMTPIGLGGKNGPVDRRLQRYIAARLGPIPGWTMGYGFDLHEWVNPEDLRTWHGLMHEQLGWAHLLGGRAHKNRLTQIFEGLDYWGYEQHRPTYAKYVETIAKRPAKPSFSEDRFRIRQGGGYGYKDYDEAMTRRGLWQSTMAGGVANSWGRLDGRSSRLGSLPYRNPHWIKTWSVFFARRFTRDMVRRNAITDAACLARPTKAHFVFYKEDAEAITMDLGDMAGAQQAVAVDTLKPYEPIGLGKLKPGRHVWRAPHKSDWAIAVGDFAQPR